jgi:hypothetical protein
MNSALAVPPADLRGSQEPRVAHWPEYVSSAGEEAIELAQLADLHLDPWEQLVLAHSLGERPDGKWAAFEVGLVVPRQNGKGTILEARELAGLFLLGEKLLIHSAHEQATSSEHFRRLLTLIEGVPEFERRVLKAPQGKGAEAIELRGGQRIFFKTRTGGGGRGLTGDFVALDEAMFLPEAIIGALVPTMAARSIEGNPQMWYTGSAVDQERQEHGIVLARVRKRALERKARLAYFEWSAPGDDPEQVPEAGDPAMWAQANPGMGIRISQEHISGEYEGALGPREFAVERLGIGDWPDTTGYASDITPEMWAACRDLNSRATDPVCIAFDMTPARTSGSITACGWRDDGRLHGEVIDNRRGTDWMHDRLLHLKRTHKPAAVVCDASGPAGSLVPGLEQAGVPVICVTARQHAQACAMFFDAVDQAVFRHLDTQDLANALKGARKRPLGDAWAWNRKDSSVDISPLVALTLSLWGLQTQQNPKPWFSFA